MKYLKYILFLLGMICVPGQVFGQIQAADGLRMPGDWNGFSNTTNMEGDFDFDLITSGQRRWITTFQFSGTTGVQNFKFVSTAYADTESENVWGNQWAQVTDVSMNSFTNFPYTTDGGVGNNTISVENNKWYTVNFADYGYTNSEAIFMETSASPVSITSVTNVPATEVAENQAATINVELDKPKSPEEKIYIRYSTDNFATSAAVEVANFGGGISGSAEIPGQLKNTTVEFYILTTTIDDANWNGKADLATIHFENNGGENYSYFYEADITPINSASDVSRTPEITWYAVDNLSGYDFQLDNDSDFSSPIVEETDVAGTSYTVSSPLNISTRYYWRFKADTASNWSNTFNFQTASAITFANVQFPASHVMDEGNSLTVYGQLYVPGITTKENESTDISAWAGVNEAEENPANWDESSWSAAGFNATSTTAGDNDEYSGGIGSELDPGTYYFAYRYQYQSQDYGYGVIDGFWADTNQTLGKLVIKDIPELTLPADNATDVTLEPQLSWSTVDGSINQFNLQISESDVFSSTVVDEQDLSSVAQSFDVAADMLDYETTYYWRVRSEYDTTASGWSPIRSFTTLAAVPAKIALNSPENEAEGTMLTPSFVWETDQNADTYDILVSTDESFSDTGQEVINETGLTTTTFSVEMNNALQKETEYFWQVRGVNETGNGEWSNVNSFTTVGDPPAKVVLTSPEDEANSQSTVPTFDWEADATATSYQLQISRSAENFELPDSLVLDKSEVAESTYSMLQVDQLDEASTYYWRVRASNNAGSGGWSDTSAFTTSAPVPVLAAPQDGAQSTPVNPVLSWLQIEEVQHYDLQIASDNGFTQLKADTSALSDTSWVADGLNYGETYYWRVRSQLNDIHSDWSSPFSFTVKADPPSYPQLVSPDSGAINTGLKLELVWEAPASAVSYDVQVAKENDFSGAFALDTTGYENTNYLLQGLENGITYYWRVRGVNGEGTTGQWSDLGVFSTVPLTPAMVILDTPSDSIVDAAIPVEFSWAEAERASQYEFQYSEDETFTFVSDTVLSETSLPLTDFASGTEYFWRVRSVNGGGSSAWSDVRWLDIGVGGFAGPDLISPEDDDAGVNNEVLLNWDSITGADEYQVQVSVSSSFETTEIDTSGVEMAQLVVSGLQTATTYYWRVRATDSRSSSNWSVIYSFSTLSEAPDWVEVNAPSDSTDNVALPVQFSWHPVGEADYYEFRLSEQENFSVSIDSSNLRDTTLTLSGLDYDTGYFWQVRGVNKAGTGSWSALTYFKTAIPLPSAPELVNPEDEEETTSVVRFGWNEVNFADTYQVQVAEEEGFETMVFDTSGVESIVLEVPSLAEATTYYWRVRGMNRSGEGAWSDTQSFTPATATSIESDFVPVEFALYQNYPNPFNPTTKIQYDLKEAGEVRIQIYDISGRLIQTLVNERKTAGRYRVSFNAGHLASGIYLMRMEAGAFLQIKKMTLIK